MKGCAILFFLVVLLPLPFVLLGWLLWRMIRGGGQRAVAFRNTVARGVDAPAEVVQVIGGQINPGDDGPHRTRRFVRYRYEVPGRGAFEGEISDRRMQVGDHLDIVYDPEKPGDSWPKFLVEQGVESAPEGFRTRHDTGGEEDQQG